MSKMASLSMCALCLVSGSIVGVMHATLTEPIAGDIRDQFYGMGGAERGKSGSQDAVPQQGKPHATLVGGDTHNFGIMARDTQGQHRFEIKNTGTAPLTLQVQDTTCKCTLAEVDNGVIQPFASTEVLLEWEAKGFDEDFRHGATLSTNDPGQPSITLHVEGRILHVVRPVPDRLLFDRVPLNERREYHMAVFAYREEPFEILEATFGKEDLREFFEVEVEPLPQDVVVLERDAKHGFDVTVRVLPGLPLGSFSQSLLLTTNYDDVGILEVPITGSSISDISILGQGFDGERNLLRLGTVEQDVGISRKLFMLVRGERRDEIEVKFSGSDPANVFDVEIGEAAPYNNGLVTRVSLTIRIPPGRDRVARLGSNVEDLGYIDLATNHPDLSRIRIHVRFAVK